MQIAQVFAGILFLAIGAFSLLAGIMNWKWFYESLNASIVLSWFGRRGARFFYGILGIVVIVMGILMLNGNLN